MGLRVVEIGRAISEGKKKRLQKKYGVAKRCMDCMLWYPVNEWKGMCRNQKHITSGGWVCRTKGVLIPKK